MYVTNNSIDGFVETELLLNQETQNKILTDIGLSLSSQAVLKKVLHCNNTTKTLINNISITFAQLRSLSIYVVGIYMAGKFLYRNVDYCNILGRFINIDTSKLASLYQQICKINCYIETLTH